jgi:hypothetical protein
MRGIGFDGPLVTFQGLFSLVLAAGSMVLFRQAALRDRFALQAAHVLGAAVAGFAAVTLVGRFNIPQAAVLLVAAFLWNAFLQEPSPTQYYLRPLYQSGYWYIITLSLIGRNWTGCLAILGIYLVGYLVAKFLIRDYERAIAMSLSSHHEKTEVSGFSR